MHSSFISFISQGLTGLWLLLDTCFPAFCLPEPFSKCPMFLNEPSLLPWSCSPAPWEAITDKNHMKGSSMMCRMGITWGQKSRDLIQVPILPMISYEILVMSHTLSGVTFFLSFKWKYQRPWWLYNMATWLGWTTFPRIPFLICFRLGCPTKEILGKFWRVEREWQPFCSSYVIGDVLTYLAGLKQQLVFNSATSAKVLPPSASTKGEAGVHA